MTILISTRHADNLQEISDELEAIVDRYTLANVLDGLALVCSSKADHIRENWQDSPLADKWDKAVGHILSAKLYADSKDL